MICPKCKSNRVAVQVVSEQKKRGCFAATLWILLALCTFGIILVVPLLTKKGSKTKNYAICQNCGHRWRV